MFTYTKKCIDTFKTTLSFSSTILDKGTDHNTMANNHVDHYKQTTTMANNIIDNNIEICSAIPATVSFSVIFMIDKEVVQSIKPRIRLGSFINNSLFANGKKKRSKTSYSASSSSRILYRNKNFSASKRQKRWVRPFLSCFNLN
ncbi:hypothetical protein CsatB_015837 [Cannabis sativa]